MPPKFLIVIVYHFTKFKKNAIFPNTMQWSKSSSSNTGYTAYMYTVELLYNGHHWDQQTGPFNEGVLC